MPLVRVDWLPTPRKLRQFGVAVVVVATAWSFAPAVQGTGAWVLRGIAGACALAALVTPRLLRPLYLLLTLVGIPIGFVTSHLLLALLFYGVVTPTGLLLRLVKGDPLHRKWERDRATYFTPRAAPPSRRYFRSF